jgi:uncharacterized protein (DUF305 family)
MPEAPPDVEAAPQPVTSEPAPRATPWWAVAMFVAALCVLAGIVGWAIADRQSSSHPGQGSVDVGFVSDMTRHHQQALTMALDYIRNGDDPLLLQIAKEIVTYQSQEIGVMNTLLTDWDRTANDGPKAMGWMGTPIPRDAMPGLATRAQMDQLAAARGAELDGLFTSLMIQHHAGGIHMADYAAKHAESATTRYWAANMAEGQRGEIAELNRWRRNHGLDPVVPQYIGNQPSS